MDKSYFTAEIEACSDMMYRVAWSILRNNADVQDALQDAVLKAWEKRDKLREEKLFRTWITRILINACYDTQRKRRRIVPVDSLPAQVQTDAPDPDLAMALEALPEKLRLPLVLCYSEGMTYEEVADVLRIPMTTLAEGQTVLIVYGDEDAGNTENLHADWASMIGSAGTLEELRFSGYRKTMDVVVGNNPPDFFMIDSRDCIAGFIEKGLVSAFEPTQMMMDDIAAMPAFVQNAIRDNLMTEDGRLYGFPNYINSRESLYYTDAWTDSPFRDMPPPSSFEELLDFVEIYLETPHDGFCFCYDRLGHANVTWFVHMLMEYHTLQCRHVGHEPVFNDPDFIQMAERTRDLFGKLFAIEKDTKHQKGHQLFTDCYAGIATNGLDTFTQDNLIPWRIKSDQPPLLPISLQLYCVRNGSEFVDQVPAFFECIVTHRKDPLSDGNINYASYTLVHPDWVDVKAFRTDKAKMFGEKWVFTCATQEYLDSVRRLDQHAVPALEYEICWDSSIKGAHNEAYAAVDDFVNGKESAEQFSIRMDRLVSLAE